ncbi:hypothetical protein HK405_006991, partial [Cladochytrium tenue]
AHALLSSTPAQIPSHIGTLLSAYDASIVVVSPGPPPATSTQSCHETPEVPASTLARHFTVQLAMVTFCAVIANPARAVAHAELSIGEPEPWSSNAIESIVIACFALVHSEAAHPHSWTHSLRDSACAAVKSWRWRHRSASTPRIRSPPCPRSTCDVVAVAACDAALAALAHPAPSPRRSHAAARLAASATTTTTRLHAVLTSRTFFRAAVYSTISALFGYRLPPPPSPHIPAVVTALHGAQSLLCGLDLDKFDLASTPDTTRVPQIGE